MKYLTIDYKIDNIEEITKEQLDAIFTESENKYFANFKEHYPEFDIPKIKVVIAYDIWEEIRNFYLENERASEKYRPKGLDHLMKIETINGDTRFFFKAKYISEVGMKLFFTTLIEHLISENIKLIVDVPDGFQYNQHFEDLSIFFLKNWLLSSIAAKNCKTIFSDIINDIEYDSMADFTFAFKRNIRRLHYDFQGHQDNAEFLGKAISELELYVRRILKYSTEVNLLGMDEFHDDIIEIIQTVDSCNGEIKNYKKVDIATFSKSLKNIFAKCDIEIIDHNNPPGVGFDIKHGPIKLFPNLVDTHPRIVCFMDILGFKQLISEYETNEASNKLKDLKNAFDIAVEGAINMLINSIGEEAKSKFEYRMFSDCIILSYPYIDFGKEFKEGFINVSLVINTFQLTMMTFGFYVRGHVTIGSYYSTPNILFSGGLVEAFENERATVFPAISVNQKIIDKLKITSDYENSLISYDELIIKHQYPSVKNNLVLNPFYTVLNINKIFSQFDDLLDLPKEFNFSKMLNSALESNNINIDQEIKKNFDKIKTELKSNFDEQLEIYQNFSYPIEARIEAGKVIEKHRFLFDLMEWVDKKNSSMFEFVNFS